MSKINELRSLGATMLSGVMIPTHKHVNQKLYQVITVATLLRSKIAEYQLYVVFRDEKYDVWTLKLEDFRAQFTPLKEETDAIR